MASIEIGKSKPMPPKNAGGSPGLGIFGPIANLSAVGLISVLLWSAQYRGFAMLDSLMNELKEQRLANTHNIEALRQEQLDQRTLSAKHGEDATKAIQDLTIELRRANDKPKG